MSGFGTKQQCHNSYGSKNSKKALKLTNFKNEIHPCESLITEAKVLILTNIITLDNCMLVFHHLNSSLPAIFHNFFRPFKEQHSHNISGARRYVLNIPKMKIYFFASKLAQVKLTKENLELMKSHYQ